MFLICKCTKYTCCNLHCGCDAEGEMRDAERRKKAEVDYYNEGVSATDRTAATSRLKTKLSKLR